MSDLPELELSPEEIKEIERIVRTSPRYSSEEVEYFFRMKKEIENAS